MRELVFLANRNARMGTQGAEAAKAAFESEGIKVKAFHLSASQSDFEQQARHFVAQKEPYIAVGGGDGTQRDAVEILAGAESALVVVPLGTGNAWAHELGIPVAPQAMAKAYSTAIEKQIDVGVANGRAFINVATIGLTALIVRNLESTSKGRFGRLAYFPAVINSVSQARSFRVRVKTENDEYQDRVLQFVAAAGRTHAGPFPVTKHAENDDGLLSLYTLQDTDRRGLLRFGWALLRGQHTTLDEVWCCETARATIETKPRRRIVIDGEVIGRTPLHLSIRPGALKVMVPSPETPV